MPNKNAWHEHEMQQINKGFWLMYDNAEKAKRAVNPLDKLAEESRKNARAQELADYEAKHPPKSAADISLIKVVRDLRNNHPLSSGQ